MTKQVVEFKGLIAVNDSYEPGQGIYIISADGTFGKAFADAFPGHVQATVRYAISPSGIWPNTLDEVAADQLSLLEGKTISDYGARYSEITGYLWTDEDAKIGGHDLIALLKWNVGKYLWMEVKYDTNSYSW